MVTGFYIVCINHMSVYVCVCFYSFDQEGHYLLTSSSDSHIYVLDAKPSKRFSVIGYTGRNSFQLMFILKY